MGRDMQPWMAVAATSWRGKCTYQPSDTSSHLQMFRARRLSPPSARSPSFLFVIDNFNPLGSYGPHSSDRRESTGLHNATDILLKGGNIKLCSKPGARRYIKLYQTPLVGSLRTPILHLAFTAALHFSLRSQRHR